VRCFGGDKKLTLRACGRKSNKYHRILSLEEVNRDTKAATNNNK